MHTEHFGVVTQIEVGALLVGKIKNHHEEYHFVKGEEKGMFLYGGSTIVLLLEKGSVKIAEKIFEKTRLGEEYEVKMGERISEWFGIFFCDYFLHFSYFMVEVK